MPIAHRRAQLLPCAAALLLSLCSCTSRAPQSDSATVNFLIETMPANLDPRIGTDAQSQHLDSLIFDSLVRRNDRMELQPDLAESWETPDPLTYVLHLRHNVRFHDGRPLTSADVKFTFDTILTGAIKTPKRGSFQQVTSIAAPDDYTIIFRLRQPYASFLWNLARPAVGIVPKNSGPEIAQHPIGSGPFRFVSMRQDEEVLLERNPDYFLAPPHIERVRFRVVPDATVRALELRKGTADIALNSLSPDMVPALARDPDIRVQQQPGTTLAYIVFNFEDPLLARREVREAIACATDRASLVRYLLRGQARLADSLLPPNHWAYESSAARYDYDPRRAEQLLDAAGLPRGKDGVRLSLTMKTSTEEGSRLLSEALQDQWHLVGIALDLRPLELATLFSDVSHGSFELTTLRWIGANNDPDIFDYVFNSRKIPPAGANRGRYRNSQLDALLDRARVESNDQKRHALISEVQKIVARDLPYVNLWYLDNVCVYRARVTNIQLSASTDYDFLQTIQLH